MIEKKRLDILLVEKGLEQSRERAKALIMSGIVYVNDQKAESVGQTYPVDVNIEIRGKKLKYVSRGGLKLEALLSAFSLDPTGKVLADIGASTGGFTDCLLTHGAARVYCVDSGHGQLHPKIAADPRVRNCEGVNARVLTPDALKAFETDTVGDPCLNPDGTLFEGVVDGVVMDVSFISQTLIHPALSGILKDGGWLLTLIKPQFELTKAALGKQGIVKLEKDRKLAVDRVLTSAAACGFDVQGVLPSPIQGGDGNVEYIAYFIKKEPR